MKRILFVVALVASAIGAKAQGMEVSDSELNAPVAMFVNGTFVKSMIGFDLKKENVKNVVKHASLPEPLVINGVTYQGRIDIECDQDIAFTTLAELREQNFPGITGDVIYMINGNFITKDAVSYKLDKAAVKKCELLRSGEFEGIDAKFSIVRVMTRKFAPSVRLR